MSIKVKGFLKDVGGASRVTKLREENFANGSPRPDPKDPIRELADKLHPEHMVFRCVDIREASPSARVFRFESADGHIPCFQSGQYVNFRLKIGDSVLSRPYTISSAPFEARGEHPFFEITVRRNVPYFVPDYLFENVKIGDILEGALPFGFFYWEPLRDSKELVALAGGSGITPFHSMAKEIAYGKMKGCKLTILYGSVKANDIVLKDELKKIEADCPDVKVVHVLSDEPDWDGEKGFITREIIEKYSTPNCTYMFCGPLPMFRFVKKALDEMGGTTPPMSPPCRATPRAPRRRLLRSRSCAASTRTSSTPRPVSRSPSRSSARALRSTRTAATASAASAAATCFRATSLSPRSATADGAWTRRWAGSTPALPGR